MKLLQFLQESNGQLSSTRLFTLLIVLGTIIDWMHCIFALKQVWTPSVQELSLIFATMGLKVGQKIIEEKSNTPV